MIYNLELRVKKPRVLFATKCWKGDYDKFMSNCLRDKVEATKYPFDEQLLVMNNGLTEDMKTELNHRYNVLDAEDMTPMVYDWFNINDDHFDGGKNYAIAELVAMYYAHKANFDYVCWVQGDCITQNGDWVTSAIEILENEPDCLLVSPASEVNTWHGSDNKDKYCSDQAFVARCKDMINPQIYSIAGYDPDYPFYGKNSFEAMIGKYLKAGSKYRKILDEYWCVHPI